MEITVKKITPKYAQQLLELNKSNRPLRDHTVKGYVNQMKNGKWKLTGDPIRLGDNMLLDGQHRLTALIRANVSLDFVVITGLSNDVFDVIDTGKNRSASDVLAIKGYVNTKNIASITRFIKIFNSDRFKSFRDASKRIDLTNEEVMLFVDSNPELSEIATFANKCYQRFRLLSPILLGGMYYLLSKISQTDTEMFFEKLITGVDLEEGSPIRLFREKLIREHGNRSKLPVHEKVSLFVTTWNAYRRKKPLKKLEFSKSEFPKPI